MKIVVCLDKSFGMMFNNRRQSRDKILIQNLMEYADGHNIRCNTYSSELFEGENSILISDMFMNDASQDDYCFVETFLPQIDFVDEIVVYLWNRQYPADLVFTYDLKNSGFKRSQKIDFKGNSHEKITREVWVRK